VGDTLLLLLNAHHEPIPFTLPATKPEHHWERLLDTAPVGGDGDLHVMRGGEAYRLEGRSLALLRTRLPNETGQAVSATQLETLRREARRLPEPGPVPTFNPT
jgi:glycogen operon protein